MQARAYLPAVGGFMGEDRYEAACADRRHSLSAESTGEALDRGATYNHHLEQRIDPHARPLANRAFPLPEPS
jgi:hypothetical protein